MIKRNKGTLIVTSCIILLPIIAGLLLWNQLPDQIPTHWNAAGEIDGYSGKAFAVFVLPLIMLALQWFCLFITSADPKHDPRNEKYLPLALWIIPVISVLLMCVTYAASFGFDVPVERYLPVVVGLGFVIIGNYMPKFSQNYTIGIKLPWTLSSQDNWNKTHRLAGRLWVICGIVMIPLSLLGLGLWMFAVILAMVLIPSIYSYRLYKKSKTEE